MQAIPSRPLHSICLLVFVVSTAIALVLSIIFVNGALNDFHNNKLVPNAYGGLYTDPCQFIDPKPKMAVGCVMLGIAALFTFVFLIGNASCGAPPEEGGSSDLIDIFNISSSQELNNRRGGGRSFTFILITTCAVTFALALAGFLCAGYVLLVVVPDANCTHTYAVQTFDVRADGVFTSMSWLAMFCSGCGLFTLGTFAFFSCATGAFRR